MPLTIASSVITRVIETVPPALRSAPLPEARILQNAGDGKLRTRCKKRHVFGRDGLRTNFACPGRRAVRFPERGMIRGIQSVEQHFTAVNGEIRVDGVAEVQNLA